MFTVSYSQVHQAYAIALAAAEAGLLHEFLCSCYDSPGKIGGILAQVAGKEMLRNRRLDGIPVGRVVEHPWPDLSFHLRKRILGTKHNAWIAAAQQFDAWAAKRLGKSPIKGVVCVENCALASFQIAKQRGLKTVYDCPGTDAVALHAAAMEAAERTGVPHVERLDSAEVTERKVQELQHADFVLTYSDYHSKGMLRRGVESDRIVQIPLWIDSSFWQPPTEPAAKSQKLRVLFAGGITLRKGIPFLINAVRTLANQVHLTLVGRLAPDISHLLRSTEDFITVIPAVSKSELKSIYQQHDVFVMPTLGDSFGFVVLEAMACGLPVIVSESCGAPVPHSSWRVPAMDSDAIASRLLHYRENPDGMHADRHLARNFAVQFTPKAYRDKVGQLLRSIVHN